MSVLKNENIELHKRIDQLEAKVNHTKEVSFLHLIHSSIKLIRILNVHIIVSKNMFDNWKKKTNVYLPKINVNVKNMNIFSIN